MTHKKKTKTIRKQELFLNTCIITLHAKNKVYLCKHTVNLLTYLSKSLSYYDSLLTKHFVFTVSISHKPDFISNLHTATKAE